MSLVGAVTASLPRIRLRQKSQGFRFPTQKTSQREAGVVLSKGFTSPPRFRIRQKSQAALSQSGSPRSDSGTSTTLDCCPRPPDEQPINAETFAAAAEIHALIPRIWRQYRAKRRCVSGRCATTASAILSFGQMRSWLHKHCSGQCNWARMADEDLAKALRVASCRRKLRQRLGIRFQDPSDNGSWSAKNLVGYAERPARRLKRKCCELSWDTYEATFHIKVQGPGQVIEITRRLHRKPVSTQLEKRRKGDPQGPLSKEAFIVTARSRCALARDKRKRIRIQRRSLDLLPALIIRPPSGPQQWTLIYLHGMGSSALWNYSDRPHYFCDGSVALKVVVPTAPSREVSCFDSWWTKSNNSWKLTKFRSWYDYLSNYDGAREDSIDWESLAVVQRALHGMIRQEAQELGGRYDRIILGGKSQGCCTALDATLTFPYPLGGFIGLVGHLLSCTPVEVNGPQSLTPLHFFHEPEDRLMRWDWVGKNERRLRQAGYRVRSRRIPDPENHGHFIEGVEGAWIRTALRSICAPPDGSTSE